MITSPGVYAAERLTWCFTSRAFRDFVLSIVLFLSGPGGRKHLALDPVQRVERMIKRRQPDDIKTEPIQTIEDIHQDGSFPPRRFTERVPLLALLARERVIHPLQPDPSQLCTLEFKGGHHPPDAPLAEQRVDDPPHESMSRAFGVDQAGTEVSTQGFTEHRGFLPGIGVPEDMVQSPTVGRP